MMVAATPDWIAEFERLTEQACWMITRPYAGIAVSPPSVRCKNKYFHSMKKGLQVEFAPAMLGLEKRECASACHWSRAGNDYFGIARKNGIPLRFDAVKHSVEAGIDYLNSKAVVPNQFGAAIYTFSNSLTEVW